MQALLLRNKIADIIQDEFTREMNYQAMKLMYKIKQLCLFKYNRGFHRVLER